MNQMLVDLQFGYKANQRKKVNPKIDNFLNECVQQNKQEIVKSITRLKQYESMFIIETFAFEIVAGMFAAKSQKELLQIIKSGSIHTVTNSLLNRFLSDEDIKLAIQGGKKSGYSESN